MDTKNLLMLAVVGGVGYMIYKKIKAPQAIIITGPPPNPNSQGLPGAINLLENTLQQIDNSQLQSQAVAGMGCCPGMN